MDQSLLDGKRQRTQIRPGHRGRIFKDFQVVWAPPLSALVPFPIDGRSSSQPTPVKTPGVAGRRQQTPVQPGRRGLRSSIFVPVGDPEWVRLTALPHRPRRRSVLPGRPGVTVPIPTRGTQAGGRRNRQTTREPVRDRRRPAAWAVTTMSAPCSSPATPICRVAGRSGWRCWDFRHTL